MFHSHALDVLAAVILACLRWGIVESVQSGATLKNFPDLCMDFLGVRLFWSIMTSWWDTFDHGQPGTTLWNAPHDRRARILAWMFRSLEDPDHEFLHIAVKLGERGINSPPSSPRVSTTLPLTSIVSSSSNLLDLTPRCSNSVNKSYPKRRI
jgi:hypothetical protein